MSGNQTELKKVLGLPMRWDINNALKNYWNPDDPRLFPEKYFGIGWDVNFYTLTKRLGVIQSNKKAKPHKKADGDSKQKTEAKEGKSP